MAILKSLDDENTKVPRGNEDIKNANVNLRNHIHKYIFAHSHVMYMCANFVMHDEHFILFLEMEENSFC